MKRQVCAVLILIAVWQTYVAVAQQPAAEPSKTERLKAAVEKQPNDGNAWEDLGNAYHEAHNDREAVAAFKNALEHGYDPVLGKYALATGYAGLGDKTNAIRLVEEFVEAGLVAPIGRDPEFASLVGEPKFDALATREQAMTEPCRDAKAHPEYRQLDFWVGDWDVFSGSEKVGDSKIQLILKDCVVLENWTDFTGGSGKSLNKFDPVKQQWEQFWVEDNGSTNYFSGNLVDGEMRYELRQKRKNGTNLIRHLTFSKLPNGSVRQFSQSSTDDGKTWSTEYDYEYRKRAQ